MNPFKIVVSPTRSTYLASGLKGVWINHLGHLKSKLSDCEGPFEITFTHPIYDSCWNKFHNIEAMVNLAKKYRVVYAPLDDSLSQEIYAIQTMGYRYYE